MIAEALNSFVTSRTKSFSHDRSMTVGASEVGMCARRVAFAKTMDEPGAAVPVDEDYEEGWGARERGDLIENALFVPAVRARFGASALYTGDEQRTFAKGFLSATPDGLLIDQPRDALASEAILVADGLDWCRGGVPDIESDCVDLDCKSIDPRARLVEPKPGHVFQIHAQIGLVRETTPFRPLWGLISYIDASFLDRVTEFAVRFDPAVYERAKDRARQIMSARHGAELRPEGVIAGGAECRWCPFTRQCGVARASRVPKTVTELPAEVAETIRGEAEAAKNKARDVEALEAEITGHKERIRDTLEAAGSRGLAGVASWTAVKGRSGWDNGKIREAATAAGINLAPYRTSGDPSDRLTLG